MGNFVIDDLADFLSSGGISTTIYRGFMPDTPDEALQLVETGGYPPVYAFGTTVVEERPTVQLMRRSSVANRARADLYVIKQLLDGMGDRSINGTAYKWVSVLHNPMPIGRDQSNRERFVMNAIIAKAVTTATST